MAGNRDRLLGQARRQFIFATSGSRPTISRRCANCQWVESVCVRSHAGAAAGRPEAKPDMEPRCNYRHQLCLRSSSASDSGSRRGGPSTRRHIVLHCLLSVDSLDGGRPAPSGRRNSLVRSRVRAVLPGPGGNRAATPLIDHQSERGNKRVRAASRKLRIAGPVD